MCLLCMVFSVYGITGSVVVSASSLTGYGTPLTEYLTWDYPQMNPNCTGPLGGVNGVCEDVRLCDWAKASLIMGGWPAYCGWVGENVPKVCCHGTLVYGKGLMKIVEAEQARKIQCGQQRQHHFGLSETENKFQEVLANLPKIDFGDPNKYDPPLEYRTEPAVSPVGGSPSRQGDFPWMVAIYKGSSFWCGGSLIDRKHILTAAHCVVSNCSEPNPKRYSVRIGNIYKDGGAPFAVAKIKVHKDYVLGQHYHDIAILTLAEEVLHPIIVHICLPGKEVASTDLTGKNTTLLGWGDTEFGGKNAKSLHIVDDIPVVSNKQCNDVYRRVSGRSLPRGITDTFICAGLPEGGKDACQLSFMSETWEGKLGIQIAEALLP